MVVLYISKQTKLRGESGSSFWINDHWLGRRWKWKWRTQSFTWWDREGWCLARKEANERTRKAFSREKLNEKDGGRDEDRLREVGERPWKAVDKLQWHETLEWNFQKIK